MLETFLQDLLPTEGSDTNIFQHASNSVDEAKAIGARFKNVHRDKAIIHSWLAWEDAPGAQLHEAVKFKFLNVASPKADAFVTWFRSLFNL